MSNAITPTEPQANAATKVGRMIKQMLERSTLHLPADYSADNAIKSAWLDLQQVQDRNGKPALEVCTEASIINALLDMVVQGLKPAKNQCYFIVYGNQLVCQRSYFGDQALAQRVMPGIEIIADVVYQGDVFEFSKIRGRNFITNHQSKLENIDPAKIKAAYCTVVSAEGEDLGTEIMTVDQIHKSWSMSKTYKADGGNTPHHKFADQMCLRTVIRRRCKPIINSSSDALLLDSYRRQEELAVLAEQDERESLEANGEIIELPTSVQAIEAQPEAPTDAVPPMVGEPGQQPELVPAANPNGRDF